MCFTDFCCKPKQNYYPLCQIKSRIIDADGLLCVRLGLPNSTKKYQMSIKGRTFSWRKDLQPQKHECKLNEQQQQMTTPRRRWYRSRTSKTWRDEAAQAGRAFSLWTTFWLLKEFSAHLHFMMKLCVYLSGSQPKFWPTCDSPAHYNPVPDSVTQFKGEKLFHSPVNASVYLLLSMHNRGILCVSGASLLLFFSGRSFSRHSHVCTSIIVRTLND